MGYFSNGTEGISYEEKLCSRCRHYDNCPILLAHMIYNYEEEYREILDIFIPMSKNGLHNEQCTMFMEANNG